MSILKTIKGWINMFLRGKSKDVFKVESVTEEKMESFVKKCVNIYKGMPEWVTKDGDVKSINFAKAICSETARFSPFLREKRSLLTSIPIPCTRLQWKSPVSTSW